MSAETRRAPLGVRALAAEGWPATWAVGKAAGTMILSLEGEHSPAPQGNGRSLKGKMWGHSLPLLSAFLWLLVPSAAPPPRPTSGLSFSSPQDPISSPNPAPSPALRTLFCFSYLI